MLLFNRGRKKTCGWVPGKMPQAGAWHTAGVLLQSLQQECPRTSETPTSFRAIGEAAAVNAGKGVSCPTYLSDTKISIGSWNADAHHCILHSSSRPTQKGMDAHSASEGPSEKRYETGPQDSSAGSKSLALLHETIMLLHGTIMTHILHDLPPYFKWLPQFLVPRCTRCF